MVELVWDGKYDNQGRRACEGRRRFSTTFMA